MPLVNSNYNGRFVTKFPSPVDGAGMACSVDVCKVPAPPAPFVPVPYPTPTTAWGTSAASKQVVPRQLKTRLQSLHGQISALCGGDPTAVHKALDEYADVVSKLHVHSAQFVRGSSNVKMEGASVMQTGSLTTRNIKP